MNTIGNNQGVQPTGPGVQVQDKQTHLKPMVGQPAAGSQETQATDAETASKVQPPAPQPKTGQHYLDPDQMKEFVARVSEAIRKASVPPHVVGYRLDPSSEGYLIEIRRPDGTLVTSFAPENVLNQHGKTDDLSGMVIDLKT
jgi:hypothetical protein